MLMNLKNFTLRSERLLVIALLACSTPHAFAISMVSEDSHNPVVNQQDTHVKGTVIDSTHVLKHGLAINKLYIVPNGFDEEEWRKGIELLPEMQNFFYNSDTCLSL